MEQLRARLLQNCSMGRRPSTAPRPHGAQLDAVGSHHRTVPRPIPTGRLTDDLTEGPAERPQTGESDVEADRRHGAVSLTQQEHRALNPPPLQVAMGRLAENRSEAAAEVGWRDVGDCCHRPHIERLGIGAVHGVAGTKQPPIEVLRLAAHPPTVGETVPAPTTAAATTQTMVRQNRRRTLRRRRTHRQRRSVRGQAPRR